MNLECVEDIIINRDFLELYSQINTQPVSASPLGFCVSSTARLSDEQELKYMSASLITFTVWRRLELIDRNVLPVCMILCMSFYFYPFEASVNDLDSSR